MDTNTLYLLAGLVLGGLGCTLGAALYRTLRRWWYRQRYGAPIDHSMLLVEYGRRMTSALDREALRALLTSDLPRALGVERAVLLLPESHRLVDGAAGGFSLPVSHAAVRRVASAGEALLADRGGLRTLIEQGRADLGWSCVWVPLLRGFDLHGLWLLGAPGEAQGRRRYSPADLEWLTAVGRQAAVVLEAMYYAERERWTADEMRALYRQAVSAREAERSRMSRELHDGVLQDLCAVTRDLKALSTRAVPPEQEGQGASVPVEGVAVHAGEIVNALRAICNDLRPPLLQQDLGAALRTLVAELDGRSPAPIHIDLTLDELRLADDTALAVFRITQEALHNAIQHAGASEIAVRLTQYPDHLRLTVVDDGCGIAGGVDPGRFVAQGHFGLAGMRERAAMIGARLDVQTAVEYGTAVILELPV